MQRVVQRQCGQRGEASALGTDHFGERVVHQRAKRTAVAGASTCVPGVVSVSTCVSTPCSISTCSR